MRTISRPVIMRRRRGLSSVLAMVYLTLMAALAVGFYTAIDMGSSISDNEQYINHSSVASEAALSFARYQISQMSLPYGTSASNLLSAVYTQLQNNLNGTSNVGGNNPMMFGVSNYPGGALATLTVGGSSIANYGYIVIPGPNVSGGVVTSPNWMNVDGQGGKAYLEIAVSPNTSGTSQQLVIQSVAENSNSSLDSSSTPIIRKQQLSMTAPLTVFSYGLFSNGPLYLDNAVTISGPAGAPVNVYSANPGGSSSPIAVNSTGCSISGNFNWTGNPSSETNINWNSMTLAGSAPTTTTASELFTAPATPTFDSSPYLTYAGNPVYGGSTRASGSGAAVTLTNVILNNTSSAYIFNNNVTIKGVLYIEPGVTVHFNGATTTIEGSIVEGNGGSASSASTLTFNSNVIQNSMTFYGLNATYPAEAALTGAAIMTPTDNLTFNGTVQTASGDLIASNLTFNKAITVSSGAVLNLGQGNITFGGTATLQVNPVNTYPSNTTYQFTATPTTYTEVTP